MSPVIFAVFPVLVLPWWFVGEHPWFYWIKTFSLLAGSCYVWALRFRSLYKKRWAYWGVYAILIANILEAVVLDFLGSGFAHIMNAVAGVLLILTVSIPTKAFHVELEGTRWRDFLWDMTYGWIFAYTFWNFTFVYLNYPHSAARMIAVLAAPLIVSLFKQGTWMQARFMTLAFHMMLVFSYPPIESFGSVAGWYTESGARVMAVLSLASVAGYAGWIFWKQGGFPLLKKRKSKGAA
jgi:hypothetical protein